MKVSNKDIVKAAIDGSCSACEKTMEYFTTLYGVAAGNFALITLPMSGLFLIGSLTEVLEDWIINKPQFMNGFSSKGRGRDLMNQVPIFILKDSFLGVKGSKVKTLY